MTTATVWRSSINYINYTCDMHVDAARDPEHDPLPSLTKAASSHEPKPDDEGPDDASRVEGSNETGFIAVLWSSDWHG